MSTITWESGKDTSFERLQALQSQGYSVARACHFAGTGLTSPNLGMAALGFDIMPYDFDLLGVDSEMQRRYQPTRVGSEDIATLPTEATIEAAVQTYDGWGVADYHTAKLNRVFGSGSVTPFSRLIAGNQSVAETIVRASLAIPEIRCRYTDRVDENGKLINHQPGQTMITEEDIYGIGPAKTQNVRMPLPVVTALYSALQAEASQRDVVFSLAGRYVKYYLPQIADLAIELLDKSGYSDIKTVVVPTENTITVAKTSKADILESFYGAVIDMNDRSKKRSANASFQRILRELRGADLSTSADHSKVLGGEGLVTLINPTLIPIARVQEKFGRLGIRGWGNNVST